MSLSRKRAERWKSRRRAIHARRNGSLRPALLTTLFALVLASSSAVALAVSVVNNTDSGDKAVVGSLSWAIDQANTTPGTTIDINVSSITLSGSILAISGNNTTINGNNVVITANGNQAFFIAATGVSMNNMTIDGANAKGANGGNGAGGGGGGLGAGGAIYIDQNATASISGMIFTNNKATGGNGGNSTSTTSGGAGGGYNVNSNTPNGVGTGSTVSTGGAGSGGGAGGNTGNGTAGTYGGGGGGDGSTGTATISGNGGGVGAMPGFGGGGGNALGGAIFVGNGGSLTIVNSTVSSNIDSTNTVSAGLGGTPSATYSSPGGAFGSGLYVGIGSTASFNNATTVTTISGDILNHNRINIQSGLVIFSGNTVNDSSNTQSGIVVSGGTLSGTTNSIVGTTTNSSTVIFNQTFDGTFTSTMSGTGAVMVTGSGTVTFAPTTGSNSYTGGTTVTGGTLAGNTRGLQGTITNSSNVTFNQSFNGTYAGNMTGTGSLTKTGTGTVDFTSTNSVGSLLVGQGTFLVDGALTASSGITVASGATLAGSGTIAGDTTITGLLGQSGVITTQTFNGNLSLGSSSTTVVNINPPGNTAGTNNDLFAVNGNVTLSGRMQVNNIGATPQVGTNYTFLSFTGTRSGSYAGATYNSSNSGFLIPVLSYNDTPGAGAVSFELLPSYAGVAQNYNQRQVGNYLTAVSGSATGALAADLAILNQQSNSVVANALQQMDAEVFGSASQLALQATTYEFLMLRRVVGAQPMAPEDLMDYYGPNPFRRDQDELEVEPAAVSSVKRADQEIVQVSYEEETGAVRIHRRKCDPGCWTGSMQAYGLGGMASTDNNAAGGVYNVGGTLVTMQRQLDANNSFGLFGSYGASSLRLTNLPQWVQDNNGQIGTFYRHDGGRHYFFGATSIGVDSYTSRRSISFGTVNDTVRANYSGWQASKYGEIGTRIPLTFGSYLQPFLGMQYIFLRQNGLTESGSPFALDVAGNNNHALRNLLGTHLVHTGRFGAWRRAPGGMCSSELRAIWIHEYLAAETTLNARFDGVGGLSFSTLGLNYGRDWAVLGGGFKTDISPRSQAFLNYDLQVNSAQTFHVASGGFTFAW